MNKLRPILLLAILALATTAPFSNAQAQQLSESRLAQLLKRFPAADANGDGKLTEEEFKAARQKFRQFRQGNGRPVAAARAPGHRQLERPLDLLGDAALGRQRLENPLGVGLEVAAEVLPPDMGYEWANMSYQEQRAPNPAPVFAVAMLLVFLVLAAQYESWSLPFSVLLGTPFAAFGAYLGLWLMRFVSPSYVNNVFAQIGLLGLRPALAEKKRLDAAHEGLVESDRLPEPIFSPATKAAKSGASSTRSTPSGCFMST